MLLAIVLLAVGFVLLHNGVAGFIKKDPPDGKSSAFVNLAGGGVIIVCAVIDTVINGAGFGTGIFFLVGITYLYLGFNNLFSFNVKPLSWYCLFVAIFLALGMVFSIRDVISAESVTLALVSFIAFYLLWAVLWAAIFVEDAFGKKLGKLLPILCLIQAGVTGIFPAIMMFGGWGGF